MTPGRLAAPALSTLVLDRCRGRSPYMSAIDGRSGVGKSTLAARLSDELDASVVDGDAFFRGGVELRHDSPSDRARDCIAWRLQRPVLEALRAGREAAYAAFDWDAFDGSVEREPTRVVARPFVILNPTRARRCGSSRSTSFATIGGSSAGSSPSCRCEHPSRSASSSARDDKTERSLSALIVFFRSLNEAGRVVVGPPEFAARLFVGALASHVLLELDPPGAATDRQFIDPSVSLFCGTDPR